MDFQPIPEEKHLTGGGVPDELLQRLGQANQKFHQCRQNLEKVTEDAEEGHLDHVEKIKGEIHLAELEIESVNQLIQEHIKRTLVKRD